MGLTPASSVDVRTVDRYSTRRTSCPRVLRTPAVAGRTILSPCGIIGKSIARGGDRQGIYRCRACHAEFTVRTNSIFERSHIPLQKWLYAMYILVIARKGISSWQLSRGIEVGLDRTQPGLPIKPARGGTMTHDYKRHVTTSGGDRIVTASSGDDASSPDATVSPGAMLSGISPSKRGVHHTPQWNERSATGVS